MDSPFQTAFAGIAVICILLAASRALSRRRLPPRPKGLPLIGSVLTMPTQKPWFTFAEWVKRYGDMIYISIFGQPLIILNLFSAAVDLLDKRGSIRQQTHFANVSQNNDRLKVYRKFCTKVMGNMTALRKYDHIGEEESQRIARRLLSKPEGFLAHAEYFAAAVFMRVAYGYQVKDHDDHFVELIQSTMKGFSEITTPGRFLVELIPALRYVPDWFPGAGWKKFARRSADVVQRSVHEPYNWTKSQMEINAVDSFISDNLADTGDMGEEAIDLLRWTARAMYSSGGDTTVAALQSFFFSMAKFPQVQAQARAEFDRVIGNDRLPTMGDWDNLSFIRALTSEVLRWHSLGPTGIPHFSMEDDVYNGYFIPKGTTVIPNIWWMTHDPEVYRNPNEFNPSRFLKTCESNVPEHDPRLICFGFGRRYRFICLDYSLF
ncbi:hypothetical protein AX16_002176 [Volvariella volvacea WC 439]|nr:hypothetical protein AX16_002176 [Volvariella volvacea WC 439]